MARICRLSVQKQVRGNRMVSFRAVRSKTRPGFTLLEVLISLAILTVGASCIVALYSAAMETYRRSELEFEAGNLGIEILNTCEDILSEGGSAESIKKRVRERIVVPKRFIYNITLEPKESGAVRVYAEVKTRGGDGSLKWRWVRTVLPQNSGKILPLPEQAPERYG